jgi:hypothetical protein
MELFDDEGKSASYKNATCIYASGDLSQVAENFNV